MSEETIPVAEDIDSIVEKCRKRTPCLVVRVPGQYQAELAELVLRHKDGRLAGVSMESLARALAKRWGIPVPRTTLTRYLDGQLDG